MGPFYNEQFFNIVIFALMIAKGWSYRLDKCVCVCVCVGMPLSRVSMRGILFSSSLTPKAFLLEFIQIGFSVMQTASMETGSPAGPFFGECSP